MKDLYTFMFNGDFLYVTEGSNVNKLSSSQEIITWFSAKIFIASREMQLYVKSLSKGCFHAAYS